MIRRSLPIAGFITAAFGLTLIAATGVASPTTARASGMHLVTKVCRHNCPTPTPTPTVSPSPTDSPTPTPTDTATVCTNPYFTTSTPNDGVSDGGYYVHNNEWNALTGTSQTLQVCSYKSWNATVTATNQQGAVQTYPNVHKDYHDWSTGYEPPLANYPTITSTFGMSAPAIGVYDVAYDIWLNGVPGNREVMVWTDNRYQTPGGSVVATGLTFPGTYTGTWDLWASSTNSLLSFVPANGATVLSGTIDLRAMLTYLIDQGRVPSNSTLGQICYGAEVVDTGGTPRTFYDTDFSITDA